MDSTTLISPSGNRLSQYIALTKPRVTQLAVFCAVIGMFLSTPGMVPWTVLIGGTVGIWLLAGRRVRHQLPDGTKDRCHDAPHRMASVRTRRNHDCADPAVFGGARRRGHVDALHVHERADHVADDRHVRRLCGDLYVLAETRDAAEHRDRRRVGRHAAGAWLGSGHGPCARRRVDSRADHLRVDAAAFLGAGVVSGARTTRTPACRCCRTRTARNTRACISFCTR